MNVVIGLWFCFVVIRVFRVFRGSGFLP